MKHHTKITSNLKYILGTAILFPVTTFAAEALGGLRGLLSSFRDILDLIVPVVFGLAVLFFFWGTAQFIRKDVGNEKTREDGKQKILWSVIALFVMVSLYGILHYIGDAIGIPVNTANTNVPLK